MTSLAHGVLIATACMSLLCGCGSAGVAARASTGASDDLGCAWSTEREEISSEGSRIVLSLPPGFSRQRGFAVYGHDCGAAVMVAEASPHIGGEARTAFAAGMAQGAVQSARDSGMSCEEVEERARWVCEGSGLVTIVRLVHSPQGAVAALARGPMTRDQAQALVSAVRLDADRTYDAVRATQIELAPLHGLDVSPNSIAGAIDLVPPQGDVPPHALLAWRYVRYASHPAHIDGSAWEDGELGEAAAELAVTTLSLNAADLSTARMAELEGGRLELSFDGEAAQEPVVVYLVIARTAQGAFFGVARAPRASAGTWLASFRAHALSTH